MDIRVSFQNTIIFDCFLLISQLETRQLDEIESNPNVQIIPLMPFPKHLQGLLINNKSFQDYLI